MNNADANPRQKRIAYLTRKEAGRVKRDDYLAGICGALGIASPEFEVLDFDLTDSLRKTAEAKFSEVYQGRALGYRKIIPTSRQEALLREDLLRVAGNVIGELVLFVGDYDLCGAIKADAKLLIARSLDLLVLAGNSVMITGTDVQSGLALDFYEDYDIETTEVVIWGDQLLDSLRK